MPRPACARPGSSGGRTEIEGQALALPVLVPLIAEIYCRGVTHPFRGETRRRGLMHAGLGRRTRWRKQRRAEPNPFISGGCSEGQRRPRRRIRSALMANEPELVRMMPYGGWCVAQLLPEALSWTPRQRAIMPLMPLMPLDLCSGTSVSPAPETPSPNFPGPSGERARITHGGALEAKKRNLASRSLPRKSRRHQGAWSAQSWRSQVMARRERDRGRRQREDPPFAARWPCLRSDARVDDATPLGNLTLSSSVAQESKYPSQ